MKEPILGLTISEMQHKSGLTDEDVYFFAWDI